MRPTKRLIIAVLVFAFLGMIFSGTSTYDFVAHLDRQVHSITCSFIPGLAAADAAGTSGCHTVMMSPYSSLFRGTTWGGLPIALPAFSVFAYLLFIAGDIFIRNEDSDPDQVRYLVAATALPVLASLVYLGISTLVIKAVCKLCIGVYVSSFGAFISAILAWRTSLQTSERRTTEIPWNRYAIYFAEGVAFVVIPVLLYSFLKPGYTEAMSDCGTLANAEDKYGVMIPLHKATSGLPSIELLDPMCPACRAFDQRLQASGLDEKLDLKAVLFPLDNECNWMVPTALHPGACEVSEAVLCASDDPKPVIQWAFENQELLRETATKDRKELLGKIKAQFPKLADCVGSPAIKQKLNKSLRWAVNNSLPVLTPQLYVNGQKLCDEDTDLGLEYSLSRLLEKQSK